MGGRGGGLPAAADHSHSRGLPQTEENIPGQWSCNIGALRHQCQCMEGLERNDDNCAIYIGYSLGIKMFTFFTQI